MVGNQYTVPHVKINQPFPNFCAETQPMQKAILWLWDKLKVIQI